MRANNFHVIIGIWHDTVIFLCPSEVDGETWVVETDRSPIEPMASICKRGNGVLAPFVGWLFLCLEQLQELIRQPCVISSGPMLIWPNCVIKGVLECVFFYSTFIWGGDIFLHCRHIANLVCFYNRHISG